MKSLYRSGNPHDVVFIVKIVDAGQDLSWCGCKKMFWFVNFMSPGLLKDQMGREMGWIGNTLLKVRNQLSVFDSFRYTP